MVRFVLLLLVVVGTSIVLSDLHAIQTFKDKSVDTSETSYCAKFQPFVPSIFADKCLRMLCMNVFSFLNIDWDMSVFLVALS